VRNKTTEFALFEYLAEANSSTRSHFYRAAWNADAV